MKTFYVVLALLTLATITPTVSAQTGCISGNCVDGIGTYRVEDGTTYEGAFRDGDQHGYGVLTDSNGSSYSGPWADGKQHGNGTQLLVTGIGVIRVDGRWVEDKKEGVFVYTPPTGQKEYALFEADELIRMLTAVEAEALAEVARLGGAGSEASRPQQGQTIDTNDMRRGFGFSYSLHPGGEDVTMIVGVAPGSPSEQAGILSGDHLVAVNGQSIFGFDMEAIARALADASGGSDARLKIFRPGTASRSGQEATLTVVPGPFSVAALRQADEEGRARLSSSISGQ